MILLILLWQIRRASLLILSLLSLLMHSRTGFCVNLGRIASMVSSLQPTAAGQRSMQQSAVELCQSPLRGGGIADILPPTKHAINGVRLPLHAAALTTAPPGLSW